METSQVLEQKLKEARAKEKLDAETKEMNDLIEKYVGKCYGSRSFQQKSKYANNNAIRIVSIEKYKEHKNATAEGTIVLTYDSISAHCGPEWRNKMQLVSQYHRAQYTTNLNQDDKKSMTMIVQDLVSGYGYKKIEIPNETFETLYNCGDEIETIIDQCFSGKLSLQIVKTCGDSTTQDVLIKAYKETGIDVIDLEKYTNFLSVLKYKNIPGFFEDRFLIKDYARKSLEYVISENNKDIHSVWATARRNEALYRENKIIQDHIQLLNI